MKYIVYSILVGFIFSSCSVQKKLGVTKAHQDRNHHFGYLFIDTQNGDTLYQKNAERYFMPASTTKLFTWYSSLTLLEPIITALNYHETTDSLFFWGTGDPSFLRPDFPLNHTLEFLKSKSNKQLVFSDANFLGQPLGKGWMWDDYLESYQAEISSFPIYGNLVTFKDGLINPKYFQAQTIQTTDTTITSAKRRESENTFFVPNKPIIKAQQTPFKTNGEVIASLLSDTLHTTVSYVKKQPQKPMASIFSVPRDSILIPMLSFSDNMLAEQLMLMCSGQFSDNLSVSSGIDYMLKNKLAELPQKPRWVDGSGLSRYNLFTPEDMVFLLEKVRKEFGWEVIQSHLPSNGKNGTIQTFSPSSDVSLWAKSGSMSGVYNLAGFLKTEKGRTLTFALMNNNFTKSVSSVRKEMAEILEEIRKSN